LKASCALLKHIKAEEVSSTSKPNLLADAGDDEEQQDDSTPIWLTLTTKKHIADQKRLKPSKLAVPHPLNTSSTSTICLITADPQATFKEIVSSPAFPSALSARVTKVVGISKIKEKFNQYEAQRKLFAEHDIFLADDRIITMLPKALGKTFYKSTVKRPIPVSLSEQAPRTDGKRIARAKVAKGRVQLSPGTPQAIAAEIEKAIQSAVVNLSPSTNTSVRVGYASWDAEKLAENVEAVANGLIEKFVTKKWRGVRAIHIKGPETASLPIWLADEMWVDENDVLEEGAVVEANVGKKRKARALEDVKAEVKEGKGKKQKLLESNDDNLDKEIALRKEKLRKQKEEAARDVEDDVPKATKKSKKRKAKIEEAEVGL
jgi:ribosome biogenesis protein UTP30